MSAITIPPSILPQVTAALAAAGDATPIRSVQQAKGGFTSHAVKMVTRRGPYFLKWNPDPRRGRFRAEVENLALLGMTGAVQAPHVLAAVDASEEATGFLLQEWLTPPSKDTYQRRVGGELGECVAMMHRATMLDGTPIPGYGRAALPQDGASDGWERDWVCYYRDHLLRRAIEKGEERGTLTESRRRGLERLGERVDGLVGGVEHHPSLLHGDLHRNNVLCNAHGDLVLIDPDPLFGDREYELAYMDWVGYFPPAFYSAYEATWPCAPGRAERRDLYLLIHRLHRLNTGEAPNAAAIDGILRLYVGA